MGPTLMTLLLLAGVFLIFIVLIQRGRGGGLAGALGGAGGQSALGTRAGDVMTKVTCVVAVVWVLLAGFSGLALRSGALTEADDILDTGSDEPAAISSAKKTDEESEVEEKTAASDSKTEEQDDDAKTEEEPSDEKTSDEPAVKPIPDDDKKDDSTGVSSPAEDKSE